MFSKASTYGAQQVGIGAYKAMGARSAVDDANPHRLVLMLFDGALDQIHQARGALQRGDVPEKCRAIRHAVRIVEEGLLAPLDLEGGGEIAANLDALYRYVLQQLTMANLRNDEKLLHECVQLIQVVRDGWLGIADRVPAPQGAAA